MHVAATARTVRPRAVDAREGSAAPGASGMVLVVDDDADVRESLERGLRLNGFAVCTAADGAAALAVTREQTPDVVVLDIEMPGLDGLAFITALRALGNNVPICVVSARTRVSDRIEGLELGADDYLTKPFDFVELTARLRALLRRRGSGWSTARDSVTIGALRVEFAALRVTVRGREIPLTRREFELISVLATHHGEVVTRDRLLETVWGYDFRPQTNVVDVVVGHIRRKLEDDGVPRLLHTVRAVGFVLREEGP
ncbi:two-component system response regulator PrrA [Nocardia alba]|uniref:Two-component system response regulator PrrA n=2 Tax=Nocardia alba TaxID=225051 RepID=A0A4R1FP69_9NOCA|nr:two-component system response regulator PrrA [Nocardia alba]